MTTLYRALLRLYPASFRMEYGEEMCALFAERRAAAHGVIAGVALALGAVADTLANAPAAHWDILRQDLHYTWRTLGHARGFALTAVLVAALGVGANTATFSVADFVLVRPLPFAQSDRLVRVWERTPGYSRMELSPANYRDWKAMSTAFAALGAYSDGAVNLAGAGEPQRIGMARVSAEVVPLLGVAPLLGRVFSAAESDDRSVVLSYGLWQRDFGGDAGVLGRDIDLDDVPYRVIGVMPASFHFPTRAVAVWLPLRLTDGAFLDRNNNYLKVVGRLRPGVTLKEARADLGVVAARLEQDYPHENAETGANVYLLRDDLSDRARVLLLALCGAALCVLLLACANLANLLLARAAAREREIAVRAALGAGRERLVRQLVTESVTLAVIGGAVGVAVAVAAVPLLTRLVPTTLPIAARPGLDLRVLFLAALFTALTGIGFGLVPALRVGRRSGLAALREGARGGGGRRQRARAVLVTAQLMASVILLICAGLLVRSMWRLQDTDPGFRSAGVLTMETALPRPRYAVTATRTQFYTRVLSRVRALPGVSSAAYVTGLPLVMGGGIWPVAIKGQEVLRDMANSASLRFVTPQYFTTMGIPLRRGRDIAASDTFDRPFVAVVSESFARRYWPGQDPIGKHFEFAFADRTVVGVAGDVRVRGLDRASEPQVYLSSRQVPDGGIAFYAPKVLVVRSEGAPDALVAPVRRIVRSVDPEQPISNVRTLTDVVAGETASRGAQLRVLGALAALALLLAGVGIHGLLAFTVSRRAREIGVRIALGAERAEIASMVLKDGLILAAAGVVPGILIAYGAGRAMGTLLVGVAPADPVSIGVAAGLVVGITLLGSLLPTLRAMGVSPMEVMRTE